MPSEVMKRTLVAKGNKPGRVALSNPMAVGPRGASYGRWQPIPGEAPCWERWREIERRVLGHLEAARQASHGKQAGEPIPYTGGEEDED